MCEITMSYTAHTYHNSQHIARKQTAVPEISHDWAGSGPLILRCLSDKKTALSLSLS